MSYLTKLDRVFDTIFNVGLLDERDDSILQKLLINLEDGTVEELNKEKVVEETKLLEYLDQNFQLLSTDILSFAFQLITILMEPILVKRPQLIFKMVSLTPTHPTVKCSWLYSLEKLATLRMDWINDQDLFDKSLHLFSDSSFYVQRAAVAFATTCLKVGPPKNWNKLDVYLSSGTQPEKVAVMECLQNLEGRHLLSLEDIRNILKRSIQIKEVKFWEKLVPLLFKFSDDDLYPLLEEFKDHASLTLCLAHRLLVNENSDEDNLIKILSAPLTDTTGPTAPRPELVLLSLRLLSKIPPCKDIKSVVPLLLALVEPATSSSRTILVVLQLLQTLLIHNQSFQPFRPQLNTVLMSLLVSDRTEERVGLKAFSLMNVLLQQAGDYWSEELGRLLLNCFNGESENMKDSSLVLLKTILVHHHGNSAFVEWFPREQLVIQVWKVVDDTLAGGYMRVSALQIINCLRSVMPTFLDITEEDLQNKLLMFLSSDETTVVRRCAGELLALNTTIMCPEGVAQVMEVLKRELDWEVKLFTWQVIKNQSLPSEHLQLLSQLARDEPDPRVRREASISLNLPDIFEVKSLYEALPESLLDDILACAETCPINERDCYPE